jgi:hypothetical protein
MMTHPSLAQPSHTDEALGLLAEMYNRWFLFTWRDMEAQKAYMQLRDLLSCAESPREADQQLAQWVMTATGKTEKTLYMQARDTVQQLIAAGGGAENLIIGQTDGQRHLCQECGVKERTFQYATLLKETERRPLLRPEVEGGRRTIYAHCQRCQQALGPAKWVVCLFTATETHRLPCECRDCNHAGKVTLLSIYDCTNETCAVQLPALQQIRAASKERCLKRAATWCWIHGWYMLNKDTLLGKRIIL